MPLKEGKKAPDFTLPSTSGEDFTLSIDQKNEPCILYFYPKDFTSGCTSQACSFRDHFETFSGLNIDIYGISTDSIATHHKFIKEYNLPFELLSDEAGKVIRKYDARIGFIGVTRRVTYLLDKNHIIKSVYENMFGAKEHIKMMLKEVQ